jgi:hypothetical protein
MLCEKCKIKFDDAGLLLCKRCNRIWHISNSLKIYVAARKDFSYHTETELQAKIWRMWLDGEVD